MKHAQFITIKLTKMQREAQRSRAMGVAIALAIFVLVLYAASFARLMTGD